MLMDLFFETSAVPARRRVHFHAFMQEVVHDRLRTWLPRECTGEPYVRAPGDRGRGDPLLCFDEFQVSDIADAAVHRPACSKRCSPPASWSSATSRPAPTDDLYKDGLQRERFLPFIEMLKNELDVLELDNGRDYRLSRLIGRRRSITGRTTTLRQAARRSKEIFTEHSDDVRPEPMVIEGKKRPEKVPRQACGVAYFTFMELCGQPLGAGDYLAIAAAFESVVLADIPLLTPDLRNEARRFNTLIDTFYEAKVHVVISAAAAPEALYPEGDGSFEFQRTVSRLMEMQSIE